MLSAVGIDWTSARYGDLLRLGRDYADTGVRTVERVA